MKKISSFLYFLLLIFVLTSCKTDDPNNSNSFETVTDKDGNVYHTVIIGTQTWMVENLKTTKYNDGSSISDLVTGLTSSTGAYANYNNDVSIGNKYGKLYNFHAVKTGKLAPIGWHIPSSSEWETLKSYLGANLGTSGSVGKLLASNSDWVSSTNAGAVGNDLNLNNGTGFTALPSGGYGVELTYGFFGIGKDAIWWSTTEAQTSTSYPRALNYGIYYRYSDIYQGNDLFDTFYSVRCIKD